MTSEIIWLETLEEEGNERKLQTGRLMSLMRERKREESFTLTLTMLLEEEEEEEEEESLPQGMRKSSCSGMVGIKAREEGERE